MECYCCGGARLATDCHFKDSECRWCKKKGHIARVCRSKKGTEHSKSASTSSHKTGVKSQSMPKINKNSSEPTHSVESTITEADTNASAYTLFNVTSSPTKPFVVTIQINGAYLPMGVDTGASRTLISRTTFDKLWSLHNAPSLQPTISKLRIYTGENIEVLGVVNVNVRIFPGAAQTIAIAHGGRRWTQLVGP